MLKYTAMFLIKMGNYERITCVIRLEYTPSQRPMNFQVFAKHMKFEYWYSLKTKTCNINVQNYYLIPRQPYISILILMCLFQVTG